MIRKPLKTMGVDIEDKALDAIFKLSGVLYSPVEGTVSYTVPLFGEYMKRHGALDR